MRAVFLSTLMLLVAAAASSAQTPAPAAAQPAAPAAPPAAAPAPEPENYTYNPDGRRDPFLSLIGTGGMEGRAAARRTDGPAMIAVADISVRGVMQSRGSLIAMVQGPDNKTYIVHQG